MTDDAFSGIENEDMRNYLRSQAGANQSAVFTIAYRKATERGKSHDDAVLEAIEAERRNVYGYDYKTDKNGQPIQQGLGSEKNPSINHYAALKKAEQQGREAPGSWEKAVKALWRTDPEKARSLGLPQHRA